MGAQHSRLLAEAERIVGHKEAEDVLQSALGNALEAIRDGNHPDDLSPWLTAIVHNRAIDERRGDRPVELPTAPMAAPSAYEVAEEREHVRRVLDGLCGLPRHEREALVAAAVDGKRHEEIAEALGRTQASVRMAIHRARRGLRHSLGANQVGT